MSIKNKNKNSIKLTAIVLSLAVLLSIIAAPLTGAFNFASAKVLFKDVTGLIDFSAIMSANFASSVLKGNQAGDYEDRTVIICLEDKALSEYATDDVAAYAASEEGKKNSAKIVKAQDDILNALEKIGVDYTLKSRYTAIDNAIAVKINTRYVSLIKNLKGVESVVITSGYSYPQTTDTYSSSEPVNNAPKVYGTGVYDSSSAIAEGLDGSGTIVAIIDTGIDYTHCAFSEMPEEIRFSEEDISEFINTGLLKAQLKNGGTLELNDVYVNAKIPFAFDYADNDTDVYPSYSNHGTHVAGIVAGHDPSGYTDKDGNHVDEEFIGVAPNAQLMICKVFTDNLEDTDLGGAETEDILSALEDCILIGVDVINMSLGTTCGFTSTDDGDDEGEYLNRVYTAIGKAGISLVCAASNDYSSGYGGVFGTNLASNPDSGTVGSPATFAAALSVASISGKKSSYLLGNGTDSIFFENSNDKDNNPFDFIEMMLPEGENSAEYEYVVVPGVGRASDYTTAIRQLFAENPDRIALVERGDTTFKEKVEIAQSMGAKAIIVYNNVSGTIRMSLGEVDDPIPAISIDMNAGAALVNAAMNHSEAELSEGAVNRIGKLVINSSYEAGPFMSEFSSWGCTPDLKLKPEITAHGGEITSTVPGGYDEQSGTSMASPNMAGVVALIREYVKQTNPDMTPQEVNRRINQLLMSTATTIYDRDGLPYSPRKQGAGLGSLDNSYTTMAYLWVDDAEIDYRPKVELGDDKDKNGIYYINFKVTNFGESSLSFSTKSIFMTETLAIDNLTVAESAYILDDNKAEWTVNGKNISEGEKFTVKSGETSDIRLALTLSDDEKRYIDESFSNGMFVEGFAKLISNTEGQCDLELPFMGFYGNWADAPMLDYDAYELAKYQQDSSILDDEKPQASVWATQPYNVYSNDEYVLPMGSYVYLLDEDADQVYTSMEHNAISCFNQYYGDNDENNYLTAYKMKGLYAGLLRNARKVDYRLIDKFTGEVIQSETVNRIGKAYSGGGTARPAFIDVPLDPTEAGLVSNGTYTMEFEFYLDYGDGSCTKNTFSYDFTVDYEAPVLQDVRVRFYDYKEGNKTKQKIYIDLDVYDNHYSQSAMLCYLDGEELILATDYVTPIYNSAKNGTTTVSIEITDIYDKYKDALYVQFDDYALNHSVYHLDLTGVLADTTPDKFTLPSEEENISLGIYETHIVELRDIGDANISNFRWSSDNRSIADVKNGEIVGISEGKAIITVSNGSGLSKNIAVTVTGEGKTLETPSISFGTIKDGDKILTKASGLVDVYPGSNIELTVITDPWYYPLDELEFEWESTNPNVANVDSRGNVTTVAKGTAVIKASIVINGKPTAYTATVTLNVQDPFVVENYALIKYNGPGGVVVIPTDKNIHSIGEEAFKDNDSITEIVIPKSVSEIGKSAFENCTALEKIYFDTKEEAEIADADINIIYTRAFAGCTSLKLLDLTNVKVITLGRECFAGCTSLTEIRRMDKIGTAFEMAFAFCSSLESIDITGMHVTGNGAFAYCTSLKNIKNGWFTDIGDRMFYGCTALKAVNISASSIGNGSFERCTSLRSVNIVPRDSEVNCNYYIGNNAFAYCTSLQSFNVQKGCTVVSIGDYAFGATALRSFTLTKGITSLGKDAFSSPTLTSVKLEGGFDYEKVNLTGNPFGNASISLSGTSDYVIEGGVIYNKEKSVLLKVLPGTLNVNIPATVKIIYDYAFEGSKVNNLNLPSGITVIGKGAFENSDLTVIDIKSTAITKICENAFNGTKITQIILPASVKAIEASAFENSLLISFDFNGSKVTSIGDKAFAGCKYLKEISLPDCVGIMGDRTFDGCVSLVTANIGNVADMGNYTFAGCEKLESVSFSSDATATGSYTFINNKSLKTVILSQKQKVISESCFYGCSELESIDLKNVTAVNDNAFYECTSLESVTGIENIVSIGDMSFYNCNGIKEIDLESAETIGAGAFAVENEGEAFTAVNIPVAKEIGVMAFMGGNEKTVVIPSSLETLGYGAFSGSSELEAFTVEGNAVFFENDGVLYRKLECGGFELSAYPGGKKSDGNNYTVIDGTVSVAGYAFNRIKKGNVKEVTLPYSVTNIGVSAFFESGIEKYRFYSIQAPALATVYREDTLKLLESNASDTNVAVNGLFYSNFDTLFARYSSIVGETSDLVMYIPENGIGYNNYIYTSYFGKEISLGILMDDITRSAIQAIEGLENIETVEEWLSLEVNEENKAFILEFASRVKDARRLVGNILSDTQMQFVPENAIEKLSEIEKLTRTLKQKFGIPLTVSDVRPGDGYKKEYTEGEEFSLKGLTITVVYDDGSTEEANVKDLVLISPADGKLTVYDNFVVFEYIYGEDGSLSREVNIPVTVTAKGGSGSGSSIPTWLIVLLLIVAIPSAASYGVKYLFRKNPKLKEITVKALRIDKIKNRRRRRKQRKVKRIFGIPANILAKYAIIVILCGAVIGAVVYAAATSNAGEDKIPELTSHIVYNANGGLFENNMSEKTVGYADGSYPLDIGNAIVTNGSAGIKRTSYLFTGWFYPATDENGNLIYEDEENSIVKIGEGFNFSSSLEAGTEITLYAGWVKDRTLPIKLADGSITDKNGNKYEKGDILRELSANASGQFVKFTGSNLVPVTKGEYTFVEYYIDEECTVPVSWPITIAENVTEAPPIYAKFIEGDWKIVSDTESAKKMLQSLISGNYYVISDIDMDGASVTISNNATFGAVIEGNGKTISDFTVTKRSVESTGTSLFGAMKDDACLHDLTLSEVTFNVSLKGDADAVYFLFGDLPEYPDIAGSAVYGEMTVNCPDNSIIGNLQQNDHSHWIVSAYDNDDQALASIDIDVIAVVNVNDYTFSYPNTDAEDSSGENDD